MSETVTEPVAEEPLADAETVQTEVAQSAEQEAQETQVEEPEAKEDPKPSRGDRRFANLTARMATLEEQVASERRRAEAAEALLHANREVPAQPEPVRQSVPDRDAIRAEMRYEERRDAVVERGNEAFGAADFAEKAAVLQSLGATNNVAFMQALVELPNAHELVAEFSDDTDSLVNLLRKPPVAMAAEMGRMAARIETKAAAPAKPLSAAPRPVQPVHTGSVTQEVNLYSPKMTMAEWAAHREKTAPKRLGGRGG